MHPIQLTEQQRSNLLEMCKILFSEFQIKYFIEYDIEREPYESDYLEIHSKGKVFNCIHWFEFCMRRLYIRMYQVENGTFGISDAHDKRTRLEIGDIILLHHPVDYLYNKFKKLKQ